MISHYISERIMLILTEENTLSHTLSKMNVLTIEMCLHVHLPRMLWGFTVVLEHARDNLIALDVTMPITASYLFLD